MRKKKYEVNDIEQIELIIKKAHICRIAFTDGKTPYIVPLNFGYKRGSLFFHTGHTGLKMDMLAKNSRVCFEMDIEHKMIKKEIPCSFSMHYKSVIGFGEAHIIIDKTKKKKALDCIMSRYIDGAMEYKEENFNRVAVLEIVIDTMTGRNAIAGN